MKKIILIALVMGLLFTSLAVAPATAENIPKTPIWNFVQRLSILQEVLPTSNIDIDSYDPSQGAPFVPGELRIFELNISYWVEKGKIGGKLLHLYRNRLAMIELEVDNVSSDGVQIWVEPALLAFPISEEKEYSKAVVYINVSSEMSENKFWFHISLMPRHGRGPFGIPTLITNHFHGLGGLYQVNID